MFILLSCGFGAAQSQSDGAKDAKKIRAQIDVRKIQWPAPPAVPRIQMLSEISGEQPESGPVAPVKKAWKPTWKERLAGIRRPQEATPPRRKPRPFVMPYAVVADPTGRIYVVDSAAQAIAGFDQDGNDFEWYRNTQVFKNLAGLAIDVGDRLYVTDSDLHRVIVINRAGETERAFGAEQLVRPAGAAMDNRNLLLYVADPGQDRIVVFETVTYSFIRMIGASSNGKSKPQPGILNKPTNVAIGADGRVYVSDTLNGRIQVFDSNGRFLRTIGSLGNGPGTLYRPKGISIDSDGHIWVADAGQSRVQVFDREGHLLAYFGCKGELPGQFVLPSGLFIDEHNRVIVSDASTGRVQVFHYVTESEAAALKKRRHEAAAR